ncbi:hypothetical protein SNE25_20075 [Mucilaginibacter sabulilitoris]|uniref:KTSC domain-containing protein n=1 Tax=Mucilaginibacter sabulilitoris TaxID=1173583 RepID=A0ABZ0TF40_9SPHI|nr:hypothetical protein [Mucilaginibacter sabulilitoris]WPU91618.1 hypothetical protein SNE25_20075 [Mucilaginibacter sabulilitoris]
MITMEQYEALNEAEKAGAIVQGEFLADREENGMIVQLYSLGKIYRELYYDPQANKVLRYRAFQDIRHLAPYLAHIRFNQD